MKLIELTDQEHAQLTKLADDGTNDPPSPKAGDSVFAANALARAMRKHLHDAEDIADTAFIDRLYGYFPGLMEYDESTDQRGLFKESLDALLRVLPQDLRKEPLVVGSFLMKMMYDPSGCGLILATEAWKLAMYPEPR
jgi:hypothetical protein